jgi:hypothetical protein
MRLRKLFAALGIAAVLAGCGENTDLERGETNCDDSNVNSQDAECNQTGNVDGDDEGDD